MKTQSPLQRALQALLITGISTLALVLAPAHAAEAPKVTANNYVRAESDLQMKLWIKNMDCFGKFNHNRKPYEEQRVTVRGNQDTLYSFGVWDLRSPVTVTLPETEGR